MTRHVKPYIVRPAERGSAHFVQERKTHANLGMLLSSGIHWRSECSRCFFEANPRHRAAAAEVLWRHGLCISRGHDEEDEG